MNVERGEIYWVDLSGSKGSEQRKKRPCLIIQNDEGNRHAPTTIIAPVTGRNSSETYPFEVPLTPDETNGLEKQSLVDLSQIRTASKKHRIQDKIGELPQKKMQEVNEAIRYSLGLN